MVFGEGKNRRQTTVGKGALDGGCGLPRARSALAMTEAERTCVSFRDQSADWSWESVIPLHKGRGERIATAGVRTGFAMTPLTRGAVQVRAGRCGERTERCRWQKQRSERVAAVKILSVRRKAAQKFWAPQQDHRPLRRVTRGAMGGRPQGSPLRSAARNVWVGRRPRRKFFDREGMVCFGF